MPFDRDRRRLARPSARADAIVVLGCRLRPDGGPSRRLRERVALGVRLYHQGAAPVLLLAGGGGEAAAMAALARAEGVPEPALVLEASSRNTSENALFTARLLWKLGLARVLLVSHRTHLVRARLLFGLVGLEVTGTAGVSARSVGRAFGQALYEASALPRSIVRVLRRRGA